MAGLETQHWQKWEVAGLGIDSRGASAGLAGRLAIEWKRGR